jgi:TRAP-type uncharacterized transport system substrate-binding protein
MPRKSGLNYTLMVSAASLVGLLAWSSIQPAEAQRKSIRWATSSVDSYGYRVAASMVKLVEDALGGEYTITVNPYPSTTAAMKAAMDGNGEIGYTADIGMAQLYGNDGPFKGYKAGKGPLVHTWYAYPMESFMATSAQLAPQFKCWSDFDGKPVFYTTAGFMNFLNFMRISNALGYKARHVQIDPKTQADALQAGTIVGAVAYTTAERSLATYWRETDVRMDITVINPCPNEVAKLKSAGLAVSTFPPSPAFSQDVGVKEISGVPILFGYNMRSDMPEDVVYKMLTGLYKNREKLVAADPGFTPLAKNFVGMQVNGINANPNIPVHAGLAKFLKEHNAWDDKWKVAGSGS